MLVCSLSGPIRPTAAIPLLAPKTNPTFELSRHTHIAIANAQFSGVVSGDFHPHAKPDSMVAGGGAQQDIVPRLGSVDGTFRAPSTIHLRNLDTAQKTVAVI